MAEFSSRATLVMEGTWEDVVRQAAHLAGRRVRLEVLPENGAPDPAPFYRSAGPEEWSRAFDEWAAGHVSDAPPLSDYAVSRDAIYGESE